MYISDNQIETIDYKNQTTETIKPIKVRKIGKYST